MHSRETLSLLAAGAGLALLLAGPTPAGAAVEKAGGYSYVTKSKSVEADPSVLKMKAKCPRGTHVYSGGHYNTGSWFHVQVSHSGPFDGGDKGGKVDDGWRVVFRPLQPVGAFAYAVCANRSPRYEKVIREAAESGTVATDVPCGGDRKVVGGGTAGHKALRLRESYPGFDGWTFASDNYRGKPASVHGYAICVPSQMTVGYAGAGGTVGPKSQATATGVCQFAQPLFVVGGGMSSNGPPFRAHLNSSAPLSFGDETADSWQVYIDSDGQQAPIDFAAHVVCAERAP